MSGAARNGTVLLVTALLAVAGVALLEFGGLVDGRGALLVTVVAWTGLAQGSVAAVAAADLAGARWVTSLRPELLGAARLLPVLLLLFALLGPKLDLYPWAEAPGAWLNRPFFLARNLAALAAAAWLAGAFAGRSLRGAPGARRLAVAYLLAFVTSQTLVAFDWVMSLSWPWVSSMLGLYFSVEALFAGFAAAGLLLFVRTRPGGIGAGAIPGAVVRDLGLLLFGLSVLWGGLFFAQFLLIWYGNLPEEVAFISARLAASPSRELVPVFIGACWGIPFLALLPATTKRRAGAVAAVSAGVLLGLFAERIFLVTPVLRPHPGVLLVENLLLLALWAVASLWVAPTRSTPG